MYNRTLKATFLATYSSSSDDSDDNDETEKNEKVPEASADNSSGKNMTGILPAGNSVSEGCRNTCLFYL